MHPTPTTVLLAPTLQPLVVQLSGALAYGARRIEPFLHDEPTPPKMATCEKALRALVREGGRRIIAWGLHPMEPACPPEAPSRVWVQGRAARRRRTPRPPLAPLFGAVVVWRWLSEPLAPGLRALHP
jgi:hypothetical protein